MYGKYQGPHDSKQKYRERWLVIVDEKQQRREFREKDIDNEEKVVM